MESGHLFLLQLALIMAVAHGAGYLSAKFKQPAVLGQIIAGVILGIGFLQKTEMIEIFAQIGVVLLMFIAGLETDVDELTRSIKSSSLIAIGGVVAPAALVFISVMLFFPSQDWSSALFLGVVTTATSVSISVQTLKEINRLKSKQGVMIMGAAIIDDVVGIILLTLLIGVVRPGMSSSVQMVIVEVIALFVVIMVIGFVVLKAVKYFAERDIDIDDKVVITALVICLALAFVSEEFGVAAITGAYFAGVIFSMTHHKHRVSHEVNRVSELLFTPIFFISIGMDIDLLAALNAVGIGSLLIIFGSIGKVVGCGFGARISGFNKVQSLQIGIGMVPRAEVAIIVANLGLRMSILSESDMAATILMVLVSTLLTPSLLKWSFNRETLVHEPR